jgi:hypothetical protein
VWFVSELFIHSDRDFSNLRARLTEAGEQGRKFEFTAALASPFNSIVDHEEASKKLQLFLIDCEGLSEPELDALLAYLAPRDSVWQQVWWWTRHSGPSVFLRLLAIVGGVLFVIQKILGLHIFHGFHRYQFHRLTVELSTFELVMAALVISIFALCIAIASFGRFIELCAIVVFLPFYGVWLAFVWFIRKIASLPYETFSITKRFRFHNRLGQVSFLALGVAVSCFSLLNILLFRGGWWARINILAALVSLMALFVWFYFWNFQPLLFLISAMKTFVKLVTWEVPSKEEKIRAQCEHNPAKAFMSLHALKRVDFYLTRMRELTRSNRFSIFTANCFVILLLLFIVFVLVQYSVIYWGIYGCNSNLFQSPDGKPAELRYADFAILSLNNLPIGGAPNMRGTSLSIELLLFSQRFFVICLFVIAVFAYTMVSGPQVEVGQEGLRSIAEAYRKEIRPFRIVAGRFSGLSARVPSI